MTTTERATRFQMQTTTNLFDRTCDFTLAPLIVTYLVEHGFITREEVEAAVDEGIARKWTREDEGR